MFHIFTVFKLGHLNSILSNENLYYLILDGTLFEHSVNHAADLESILILFNIFFQYNEAIILFFPEVIHNTINQFLKPPLMQS